MRNRKLSASCPLITKSPRRLQGGNRATIQFIAPDFRLKGQPLRSGKCALLFGTIANRNVVIKRLLVHERFWEERFRNEVYWYEYFNQHHPPVSVPALLAADSRSYVMAMTRAAGKPLARERYPAASLPPAEIQILLTALNALHRWRPRQKINPQSIREDYASRLQRYSASGALALDSSQVAQILESVRNKAWEFEFNHGDLLLSNCMLNHGRMTLIDWEFAGYYLPGYDLTLLWLLLANDPEARDQIAAQIGNRESDYQQAFAINRLLLIGRETRIHMALDESNHRTRRLDQLGRDLQTAWSEFVANKRTATGKAT